MNSRALARARGRFGEQGELGKEREALEMSDDLWGGINAKTHQIRGETHRK